jgi:hypothetical protein
VTGTEKSAATTSNTPQSNLVASATAAYFHLDSLKPSSKFTRAYTTIAEYQQDLWEHSIRWAAITAEELEDAGLPSAKRTSVKRSSKTDTLGSEDQIALEMM